MAGVLADNPIEDLDGKINITYTGPAVDGFRTFEWMITSSLTNPIISISDEPQLELVASS